MKWGYVYILASKKNGTLYVGVTSDMEKRIRERRNCLLGGLTSQYDVKRLVYLEFFPDIVSAIAAEKKLKNWHRQWKINLIESQNPEWRDLSEDWD